ncbi:flagellar basal body-associated protein FliL [Ornithinibacillus gellani]|uniref:flagellar basal body-associated protein FliL n=1 Tax=Ornithinibacillus gellani TaxID=2293253 RepID=UPI000F4711C5|nr:flagellar basal body-associated protein FliL [Ornithinibacillus gellani]TQS75551.1 flagellar basal body-associated protein FliL [Ornithinibacillus gellani]
MSKLVKTMLTSIISIVLIGTLAAFIVLYVLDNEKTTDAQSIDEMVELSYETPEVTTDLEDGSFVRIQFQLILDSKDAKKEITKREFQVRNQIIKELATMKEADFKSGLGKLEEQLQTKLNELMTEGEVTGVYTISKILQ